MTNPISARTIGLGLAAAILAASFGGAAVAQTAGEPVSATVMYRDLDISRQADATVLYDRIRAAASRVCGGAPDIRLLERQAAFDSCRHAAVANALASIDAPALWAAAGEPLPATRLARR